jgi:hypothetical protein
LEEILVLQVQLVAVLMAETLHLFPALVAMAVVMEEEMVVVEQLHQLRVQNVSEVNVFSRLVEPIFVIL